MFQDRKGEACVHQRLVVVSHILLHLGGKDQSLQDVKLEARGGLWVLFEVLGDLQSASLDVFTEESGISESGHHRLDLTQDASSLSLSNFL
jgi:hypothetical protein